MVRQYFGRNKHGGKNQDILGYMACHRASPSQALHTIFSSLEERYDNVCQSSPSFSLSLKLLKVYSNILQVHLTKPQ
jgi:hypothetical protein